MPIGWPIKPRPIRPTFVLEGAADSTRGLLCEVCRELGCESIVQVCRGMPETHLPVNHCLILESHLRERAKQFWAGCAAGATRASQPKHRARCETFDPLARPRCSRCATGPKLLS